MDREDVLHKMSKKIAQLTKVIFHLNTKNDEADLYLKSVLSAHEKEVEHIVKNANQKVTDAWTCFERLKTERSESNQKDFIQKYESERREAFLELQNIKKSYSQKEREVCSQWSERVSNIQEELVELKGRLRDQQDKSNSSLQRALDDARTKHQDEVNELKSRLSKDLAQMSTTTSEEKERLQIALKSMEEEKNSMEQALKLKLNQETLKLTEQMDKLHSLLDEKDTRLSTLQGQYDALQSESSGELASTLEAKADLEAKLKSLQDAYDQEQKRAADLHESMVSGDSKATQLQTSIDSLKQQLYEAKEELRNTTGKLSEKEKECTRLKSESSTASEDMMTQIERLKDSHEVEKTRWENQRKTMDAEYRGMESKLQGTISDLRAEFESQSSKTGAVDAKYNELLQNYEKLVAEDASLQRTKEALEAELDATRKRYEDELAELRKATEETTTHIEQKLKEQAAALSAEMESAKEKLISTYEEKIAEQITISNGLREESQSEAQKHAAETQKLSDELLALREKFEDEQRQLQKTHQDELEQLRSEVERERGRLSEFEAGDADLRRSLTETQALLKNAEADLEAHKKDAQARIDGLEKNLASKDSQFSDAQSRLRDGIEEGHKLNQELEKKVRDLEHSVDMLKDARKAVESNLELTQTENKELLAKLQEKENQIHSVSSESQLRMDSVVSQLTSDLHKAKEDAVKMVQELTQQHQRKIEETYSQHSSELERIRAKNEAESKDKCAALQRNHDLEIKNLADRHSTEIQDLERRLQNECDKIKRTMEMELSAAREKNKELTLEKKQLDSNCANLRDEVANGLSRIDDLNAEIHKANQLAQELRTQMKDAQKKNEAMLNALKEEAERRLAESRTAFDEQLHAEFNKHQQEVAQVEELHRQHREKLEASISMLEANVRELQQAYENRPSRPEDLETIRQLERESGQDWHPGERADAFNQLRDEMQFYKLELVNREQNYNKVFGVSGPNVGVLNPVQRKQGQQTTRPPNMPTGAPQQGGLPPLGNSKPEAAKRKKSRPMSGNENMRQVLD